MPAFDYVNGRKHSFRVQELPMGYAPKGKAGRFTVATSWIPAGQAARHSETRYFKTAKQAATFAKAQRDLYGVA